MICDTIRRVWHAGWTCTWDAHRTGWVLGTPFTDPDGDFLTLFLDPATGRISDGGETVHALVVREQPLQRSWLTLALRHRPVQYEAGEFWIGDATALADLIAVLLSVRFLAASADVPAVESREESV